MPSKVVLFYNYDSRFDHTWSAITLTSCIRINELRRTTIPQMLRVCTSIHMADTLKNLSANNLGSGTVFGSSCMSQPCLPSWVALKGKPRLTFADIPGISNCRYCLYSQCLQKLPFNAVSSEMWNFLANKMLTVFLTGNHTPPSEIIITECIRNHDWT